MRFGFLFGVGLLLLGLFTVACGGVARIRTVNVTGEEWSLRPTIASVSAGKVVLRLMNRGQEEHELVVLKTSLSPTGLMKERDADKVDEKASGEVIGELEDVAAGKTRRATFELAPGRYVLLCNIAGHYSRGMVSTLVVR